MTTIIAISAGLEGKYCIHYTSLGSKGDIYSLVFFKKTREAHCECKGYHYRGYCKHAKEVELNENERRRLGGPAQD